ncbi:MAG: hypothetical protein IIA01_07795 [Proteobacteria bacterium]|nr:hypothetical protein [Pseudomonadota bacterium]
MYSGAYRGGGDHCEWHGEGKVVIEAGAVVERSIIRGPAIVGAGARIVQAYIGPFTSIMNDVDIQDSELEHSIVLEGSTVRNIQQRISDSLIGRNALIQRSDGRPSVCRFMVGDYSQVHLQ